MLIELMFLLAAFKPGEIEGKLSKSNKFFMYCGMCAHVYALVAKY